MSLALYPSRVRSSDLLDRERHQRSAAQRRLKQGERLGSCWFHASIDDRPDAKRSDRRHQGYRSLDCGRPLPEWIDIPHQQDVEQLHQDWAKHRPQSYREDCRQLKAEQPNGTETEGEDSKRIGRQNEHRALLLPLPCTASVMTSSGLT